MRPRPPQRLRNQEAEAAGFRLRALVGLVAVVVALGGLAAWYFRLQVLQYDDYARRSEANRIKPRPVVPGRGLILDRKGRIVAENVPAYRLEVTPDDAGDIDALVASIRKVVPLDDAEVARFHRERKGLRGFRPVTLKLRVDDADAARFAVDRWRFPGVELVPYLNRRYPYGDLFAHIVGYVGRTDEGDIAKFGEAHAVFAHTGRTGLERFYDDLLRGKVGYEQVETNVEGRALGRVGLLPATAGADLRLSVDADLQLAMVRAFGEFQGSAIAVEPATGQVLAMVSLPSYDPNLFVDGISHADYQRLTNDPSRPLFNRLVLGGVAPGSTLKPMIALAGLDAGVRRPEDRTLSTGMFYLPGTRRGWGDASRGGHGWTDLRKSISQSVNTYYYRLALDLGIDRFDDYMGRYGFGQPTGIDLSGEIGGILPGPAEKLKTRRERWYPGDTVNVAIGQGDWRVSPLQLVRATAGLADGQLRQPRLVAEQRTGFDQAWAPLPAGTTAPMSPSADHLAVVRLGMQDTMQPGGTGWRVAQNAGYLMAGKTGTAQVISRRGTAAVDPRSLPLHLRHRSLFMGFAPAEAPTIAVAIAVEGGGYGGSAAAPIARKIFDAWLLGKMPDPLPQKDADGVDGEPPPSPFANVRGAVAPSLLPPAPMDSPPAATPVVRVPASQASPPSRTSPPPEAPAR